MFSIAVDAMGGENDPQAAVAATLRMARAHPDSHFILAGKEEILAPLLAAAPENVDLECAAEVAGMDEPPARAIRRRNTSMWRTLALVAEGRAQAAVSAGNTGALLGVGMLTVGKVEGIQRPAIASFMPNPNLDGGCCLLDLGANLECSAEMLHQFALMGAALAAAVRGVDSPRVGLLNVGEESFKGGGKLKQAAALLKEDGGVNFAGYVEGFDIFLGDCDVIVCDGFAGNVALKTSEGLARMISGMIKDAFRRDMFSALCGVAATPVLSRLRRDMDARRYNGACMLGMRNLVVKSHGNADDTAFYSALNYAMRAGREDFSGAVAAIPKIVAAS